MNLYILFILVKHHKYGRCGIYKDNYAPIYKPLQTLLLVFYPVISLQIWAGLEYFSTDSNGFGSSAAK